MTTPDAQRLAALGLSVIPLRPRSKLPDGPWERYQTTRATEDDLRTWFGNGVDRNAGIVLGKVSGLVVLETDSAEAEAWCAAHLLPTPMMTRSARGKHRFYRMPAGDVEIPATVMLGGHEVEVKRDGQYVVAPGSTHPSGHVYAEVEPWPASLDAVPVLPLDGTLCRRPQPGTPSAIPERITAGGRNDTLFREGAKLRRLGWEPNEIRGALLVLNAERCRPPLDPREVESIATSFRVYEPAPDTFPTTEQGDAEFFAACYAARFATTTAEAIGSCSGTTAGHPRPTARSTGWRLMRFGHDRLRR